MPFTPVMRSSPAVISPALMARVPPAGMSCPGDVKLVFVTVPTFTPRSVPEMAVVPVLWMKSVPLEPDPAPAQLATSVPGGVGVEGVVVNAETQKYRPTAAMTAIAISRTTATIGDIPFFTFITF